MNLAGLAAQDRAVRLLRRLLKTRSLPPALLFHGPEGVGKAAAATAFAKALNCAAHGDDSCAPLAPGVPPPCPSCSAADRGLDADLLRVDAELQAGLLEKEAAKQRILHVDTIRHALRRMELRSLEGRWKTAVVFDAHTLNPSASNAMLKGLEEPPPRALWILVTHRPAELLPTIRSRCQPVAFAALPRPALEALLRARGAASAAAARAAAEAQGSAARALAFLEEDTAGDRALSRGSAASEVVGAAPESWLADPMAPFTLAERLPRELHQARPQAEAVLDRAAGWLRRERGTALYASAAARFVLRDLAALRSALRRNADPRLVVELAALRLQELGAVERTR